MRIRLTLAIFQGRVELLHNLTLNIQDCGSQVDYVHHYFTTQRRAIFGDVGVMIFVADIGAFGREGKSLFRLPLNAGGSGTGDGDEAGNEGAVGSSGNLGFGAAMGGGAFGSAPSGGGGDTSVMRENWNRESTVEYFVHTMLAAAELSPNAQLFVMLHKMDLIKTEAREAEYNKRVGELKDALRTNMQRSGRFDESKIQKVIQQIVFFPTTLWDSSVFHAYSMIIRTLVPERQYLDQQLAKLVSQCDGFEAAIFERRTMLCLAHVDQRGVTIDVSKGQQTLRANFEDAANRGSGDSGTLVEDEELDDEDVEGHDAHHDHHHHRSGSAEAGGNSGNAADHHPHHHHQKADSDRANIISEVFKLFKLRCLQRRVDMTSCSMATTEFSAVLRILTKTTMVLMVSKDTSVSLALHELNVDAWIRQFSAAVKSDPRVQRLASALSMGEQNE